MSKPLHSVDPDKIAALKKALYKKAGFVIETKSHCKILSQMIWSMQANSGLSESTLYRFFFTAAAGHIFYLETLNILSAFAGYHNWMVFCSQLDQAQPNASSEMNLQLLLSQSPAGNLTQWIHNGNSYALKKYFSDEPPIFTESYKWQTGVELYKALLNNPKSNLPFFKGFSQFEVVRHCLFEHLADPDFRLQGYAQGFQHYLKQSHPGKTAAQLQDYVFGNSMLFRYYFLQQQNQLAIQIGHQLFNDITFSAAEIQQLHVFPASRYEGYKLWYYLLLGNKEASQRQEDDLLCTAALIATNNSVYVRHVFFYNTLEAFCKGGTAPEKINQLVALFQKETFFSAPVPTPFQKVQLISISEVDNIRQFQQYIF